jgi:hypothetical protein
VTTANEPETERLTAGAARFVLAVAYLGLAALYAWQASKRLSPTIFSDEIEFTQISRAIAENGVPSRHGQPSGFETLYTYLVAPAWWIEDAKGAWEAAKLIGVIVMTATIFPAYALARLVVSRAWAVAAAIVAVAAPPLAYAPYLLDEPLAYPVSTAALWAIAVAVARPGARRFALALGLALLATLVGGHLAVLVAVWAAGAFFVLWRTERFSRWRATWSAGDWVGAGLLVVGVVVVASAYAGHRSEPWYVATGFFKQRMVDNAGWAFAALTIGLGVLPVIACVAAFLSRRLRSTDEGRAFVLVGVTAFAAFGLYAAVKATYLSTTFANLVLERNVIYLVPIALAATAAVLARPIVTLPGLAAGLVVALALVLNADFRLDQYPYFEAPGLAIGTLANRNFSWDPTDVERGLVIAAIVSVTLLLSRWLVRSRVVGLGLAVVALAGVAAWTLTTEIYASRGLNTFSERLYGSTPRPVDWVTRVTGGERTLYLGQHINDANPIWLMEFWNRDIDQVWSLDGTAPTPSLSPDLASPDGTISPDPGVQWVVTGNGVAVVGERVAERPTGVLYRAVSPVRLRFAQVGVAPDGWMGERASFAQYAGDEGVTRGFARVVLSRQGACSEALPPATATVRVGTVVVRNKQPAMGRVYGEERRTLRPCAVEPVLVRATVPYYVEVTVTPTFVPKEIDAASGDVRELGAQVGFDFVHLDD